MTYKDKPKRSGAKSFDRDRNTKSGPKGGLRNSDKPRPATAERRPKPAAVAEGGDAMKPERISKIMARAGVASRRDIERMIMEGRVSLNGVVLDTPVVNATLADRIEVDGVPIRGIERTRLWLYHKPAGLVTTNSDPEGRPTVFDNLPEELPRVLSIGRLDINTEGLLLLTNDGGLARALELPSTGWLRRYRVRAHGDVDQAALDKLKEGIAVDGVLYGSIEATLDRTQGHNVWITMGLREGKNREIKNVLGALGLEVNRLIRISYGPFQLGDIPEGHVLEVRGRTLRDQLGPRLIEEAKANFDAPIYNEPAVAVAELEEEPEHRAERPRREREGDRRERALDRLDTRPDDRKGGDRFGRKDDNDRFGGAKPKKKALGEIRTANVWMAPGARPVTSKGVKSSAIDMERPFAIEFKTNTEEQPAKKRKPAAAKRPTRTADKRFGDKPRGDRKPRAEGAERPRGDRPWEDRKPRGEGDERPRSK
ncbi:rRNA pseudouridine synthase, partial [Rhizobiaceae bacterium n13]